MNSIQYIVNDVQEKVAVIIDYGEWLRIEKVLKNISGKNKKRSEKKKPSLAGSLEEYKNSALIKKEKSVRSEAVLIKYENR